MKRELHYDVLSFWIDFERKMKGRRSNTTSLHFELNLKGKMNWESSTTILCIYNQFWKEKWTEHTPARLPFTLNQVWKENEGRELHYDFLSFPTNFERKNGGKELHYDILSFWIDSERKNERNVLQFVFFSFPLSFFHFESKFESLVEGTWRGESSIITSFHFKSILKGKRRGESSATTSCRFPLIPNQFSKFWNKKNDNTSLLQRNPSKNLSKTKICAAKKPTVYHFCDAPQNLSKTKVFGAKELAVHHFCNANPSKTEANHVLQRSTQYSTFAAQPFQHLSKTNIVFQKKKCRQSSGSEPLHCKHLSKTKTFQQKVTTV